MFAANMMKEDPSILNGEIELGDMQEDMKYIKRAIELKIYIQILGLLIAKENLTKINWDDIIVAIECAEKIHTEPEVK